MKVNVWNNILQLSKERGLKTDIIVKAIEESLKVASSNYFSNDEKINIFFRPEKGELRVYTVKKVCENPQDLSTEISLKEAKKIDIRAKIGNEMEIDLPSATLGRIAVQAAKQVIFQKVRDAERERIYECFAPRLGEIITGVLRRFENNNMILEMDKVDILLPYREKLANEEFKRGDRVKTVIIQVLRENMGPQVIVSRKDSKFLVKLLEAEVPEIVNGIIEIKDLVRQPGERAKVAVLTKEKDVDPIGACIGIKGNRILSISKELQGEKIDIIEWLPNSTSYAKAALSPAKVEKVFILNEKNKMMQAVVSKDQFSLAIGKKGVNVRLASNLVGWKIEITQAQ